jgi:hypothetical protein
VIIMLNGSFGAGKSSVAEELCKSLPDSAVYDPEIVGSALRYHTKGILSAEEETDDFQDIAVWPELTVKTAEILYKHYGRTLVVPMTLAKPAYLNYIRQGLAAIAPPLYHFTLVAPLATIESRLVARDADRTWGPWALDRARRYVPIFDCPEYQVQISTESTPVPAVVEQILRYISAHPEGTPLVPDQALSFEIS